MVYMKQLARLGILRLLKKMMMKSPPFYYFTNVTDDAREIILRSMLKSSFFKTIIDEYTESHKDENLAELRNMSTCFTGKLSLMYHDPKIIVNEIIEYGGLKRKDAQLVDDVWKEIVSEYINLSDDSEYQIIEDATHYIHMSRPDVVVNKRIELLQAHGSVKAATER